MRLLKLVETVPIHVNSLRNYDKVWKLRIWIFRVCRKDNIGSLSPLFVVNETVNIDCKHEQEDKYHQREVNQCRNFDKSLLVAEKSAVEQPNQQNN